MAAIRPRTLAGLSLSVARLWWSAGLALVVGPSVVVQAQEVTFPGEPAEFADRLTDVVFAKTVTSSGTTYALAVKARKHPFTSLQDVHAYNVRAPRLQTEPARALELAEVPLESPWWWAVRSPSGAGDFILELARIIDSTQGTKSAPVKSHVLRKALVQRDLVQTHALLCLARARTESNDLKRIAQDLERRLAEAIRLTLLTDAEYDQLVGSRPHAVPPGFTSTPSFALTDNYLPTSAISADATWSEVPATGTPFKHFKDYGGRSFIRVYLRAEGTTGEQILQLWGRLYATHGENLHTSAVQEPLPPRLEAMLVRTFGVLLTSGAHKDSGWPEEVIIRAFKYLQPQFDLTTSDFRGTLFFQYKMSRAALLADPASLGLRRTLDDDEQFFGFFGDVPDPNNSYADTITTMRANCISCHSEYFYGLSTIFSFERDPNSTAENGMLSLRPDGDGYSINTEEFKALQAWLKGM